MSLTKTDPHHWGPIPQVMDYVISLIADVDSVLEVGPGHAPFKRADEFVDFNPLPIDGVNPHAVHKCDMATERLPFDDKSFGFVFCRHTLEDMWNPFNLISEMQRVGYRGYIETPSPIAELTRGVDGGAPPYRGYHHHRWIVWNSGGLLKFVSKYPVVEYLDVPATNEQLLRSPYYWNTYLFWEGEIWVQHIQSPLDYDIPCDYARLLHDAMQDSKNSTDELIGQLNSKAA